ncbi:MAG: tRNA (guanosine(46)-N7)-methyltransferase TrmB [Eubacterium sp.]|nr:tRNA (guanosine(46)-N7)-methyltransferase TrmB [Eubacterium sp.]
MRQRKIKDIDEKLQEFENIIVPNSQGRAGCWRESFILDRSDAGQVDEILSKSLFLEIGSGKGRFITSCAAQDKDGLFLAAEGLSSVIIRGMVKAREEELSNIRFITSYINDMDRDFSENELDGIFLNFSDPWPKARHAKRRLTHKDRLVQYLRAIKTGGFIRFKTDNDDLFDFTLEQIEECRESAAFDVTGLTRDLHSSRFHEMSPMTEYEIKFSSQGKNINFVCLRKR